MISFYLIHKHCKNRYSCEGCYFSKGDARTGYICMMDTTPDRWNMKKLNNAYDKLFKNDEMVDVFYKQVANKLLDVMHCKRGEEDETE